MSNTPYCYIVLGDPTPLARCRVGNRRVWDTQKADKLHFSLHLKFLHGNRPLYSGPLHLEVNFFFPIPNSRKKLTSLIGSYHHYRPDISNLIKFVEDCATGVLYHDDCLIASVTSTKKYDIDRPRTEFIITPLLKEDHVRSNITDNNRRNSRSPSNPKS